MATAAAVVVAGASIAGAVTQQRAARKARRQRERASRIQNAQARVRRQRQIRRQLAQSRIVRARQVAAGFQAGAPTASPVTGAVGATQTGVASNIGTANQLFGLEQRRVGAISAANRAISRGQEQAAIFQGIAGVAQPFTNPQTATSFGQFFS